MKKFKVKIELADGDDLLFEGFVEINIPKRKERMEFLKERLLLKKDNAEDSPELLDAQFDFLEGVFDKCFSSINLTHVKSGEKIVSKEDLDYCAEGQAIINDVASLCINGIEMGKIQS